MFAAPFSGEAPPGPRFPHPGLPNTRPPRPWRSPPTPPGAGTWRGRWGRSRSFRRLSGESFRRLPGALTVPGVEGRRGWAPRRAAVPWTDLGFKLGAPARSRAVSPALSLTLVCELGVGTLPGAGTLPTAAVRMGAPRPRLQLRTGSRWPCPSGRLSAPCLPQASCSASRSCPLTSRSGITGGASSRPPAGPSCSACWRSSTASRVSAAGTLPLPPAPSPLTPAPSLLPLAPCPLPLHPPISSPPSPLPPVHSPPPRGVEGAGLCWA